MPLSKQNKLWANSTRVLWLTRRKETPISPLLTSNISHKSIHAITALKLGSSVTKTTLSLISCCTCSIQIGLSIHTYSNSALKQGLRPSHTVHHVWRLRCPSKQAPDCTMWWSGHLARRMLQTAQGSFVFRIRLKCTEASMLALVPAQFCILIISLFGHMECTPSIAACVRSTSKETQCRTCEI